ncbi:hypothetical protein [Cellulomonas fengjieae]|uniref:Uncharacterized protein n=1 Tax=Cellulomonas fengjieae TaxID=2819978 RepID=A0ABS3SGE1_9CELL|nr:hypothetical protein [Cellulomonas fengjieae]MBO3084826.1 hypothetical protein [Cellulomonas fengjieae]MBO3103791.1 hypothetical protein [Cellulomonas fengjieae]QVI66859.1 hypothetical protein KG102_04525 [Cellulomonas fengjieae]
MSTPTPPPERQSAYPHAAQPAPPTPAAAPVDPTVVYPAAQPPPVQPPTAQPAFTAAPPPAARATGPSVDGGRYWAGVAATALVTALIGLVGVLIVDQILDIDLVVRDLFGTQSTGAAYVVGGVLAAILAGALLQLLVLSTPKPRAFFGWILFLATLTAALLPLTWTDVLESAIASGLINALIGIAIWSLLTGVLSRTLRPGTTVD